MRLSVLVTTFRRRAHLQRCIAALVSQQRPPDEIVIVTRVGDADTEAAVSTLVEAQAGPARLRQARVSEPGVLAANRAGMEQVTGDIVSFIDDDAAARPDWLRRIEAWFSADARLGALGGRDVMHTRGSVVAKRAKTVGRIRWYGRIVGNHEKLFDGSAEVEHLKGVNMSFRRELVSEFDPLIIGNAHHYELDLCFAVRRRGYKVVFDGDLLVDHDQDALRTLPGSGPGADTQRVFFIHHNRVYVMLKNLGLGRREVFLFYSFVIDGGMDVAEAALGRSGMTARGVRAIYRGKLAGLRDYARRRRPS